MEKKDAWADINKMLAEDEKLEAIVFGCWGWGSTLAEPGYGEPEPPPVPRDKRGLVLTPEEAEPYMHGWSFYGGYGHPECYAVRVWTSNNIYWVTQYDGATSLDSTPRHPIACLPDMPGG